MDVRPRTTPGRRAGTVLEVDGRETALPRLWAVRQLFRAGSGMVLAADNDEGTPILVVVETGRGILHERRLASTDDTIYASPVLRTGTIPRSGSWQRQGLRYTWCNGPRTGMIDLGGGMRDLGPCLEHQRLSVDGRHLIGMGRGAVRLLDLDGGAALALYVARGDGAEATGAVLDDAGRLDVVGTLDVPVATRRGGVDSGSIHALDTATRTADLFGAYWRRRDPD